MPKRASQKRHRGRRKKGRKKKAKMPPAVLKYFKLRNSGMSKARAKREAGL